MDENTQVPDLAGRLDDANKRIEALVAALNACRVFSDALLAALCKVGIKPGLNS